MVPADLPKILDSDPRYRLPLPSMVIARYEVDGITIDIVAPPKEMCVYLCPLNDETVAFLREHGIEPERVEP